MRVAIGRCRIVPVFFRKRFCTSQVPTTVILRPGVEKYCNSGNQLLYNNSIQRVTGNPVSGDECIVMDHRGQAIGRGMFNSHSLYSVRVLARQFEPQYRMPLPDIISSRVREALDMRLTLGLGRPGDNTAFRLLNGEGDGLSGIVADVFDHTVVVECSALWGEMHRSLVERALRAQLERIVIGEVRLVWKSIKKRLLADGFSATAAPAHQDERGVVVFENGLRFRVYPGHGQKTGFYCDQRSHRLLVRSLAAGKSVLDLFSHTGGFALNALRGGASSVVAVDSSRRAIDQLQDNVTLNEMSSESCEVVCSDVDRFLERRAASYPSQFDIVVCDPPKLADSNASVKAAAKKYIKLNSEVMLRVRPGGLLLTFSCSAAIVNQRVVETRSGSQSLPHSQYFTSLVQEAARVANKNAVVIRELNGCDDHPIHIANPQSKYLAGLLLRIS